MADTRSRPLQTYGSKKKSAQRSALVQARADQQLWASTVTQTPVLATKTGLTNSRGAVSSAPLALESGRSTNGSSTGLGLNLSGVASKMGPKPLNLPMSPDLGQLDFESGDSWVSDTHNLLQVVQEEQSGPEDKREKELEEQNVTKDKEVKGQEDVQRDKVQDKLEKRQDGQDKKHDKVLYGKHDSAVSVSSLHKTKLSRISVSASSQDSNSEAHGLESSLGHLRLTELDIPQPVSPARPASTIIIPRTAAIPKSPSLSFTPSMSPASSMKKKHRLSDFGRSISALSPFRLRTPSPDVRRPVISLPTPVETSREKLRTKLKASQSLMSLSRSESTGSLVAVPVAQHQHNQLQQLLGLCNSQDTVAFEQYIEDMFDTRTHELHKLAEASFSEVYVHHNLDRGTSRVLKVIPFGNDDLQQVPVHDIIQELSIARLVMSLDGFVDVVDAAVVQGQYPDRLLACWDQFRQQDHDALNTRPDHYKPDQLFCILVLNNAGTDLEHFDLSSWLEAEVVFWQTVHVLALAETRFKFEHRDLHWGNVVVSRNGADGADSYNPTDLRITLIDYTLSRASADGLDLFTRLDHPDFFRGKGDYQFDIYRLMRSHMADQAQAQLRRKGPADIDWGRFCPQSNVYWLHYLVDKLIYNKGLERVAMTKSGRLVRSASSESLATSERAHEARACRALDLVHSTLNPRKKRFQDGEPLKLGSASDVLLWGIRSQLIPQAVLETMP